MNWWVELKVCEFYFCNKMCGGCLVKKQRSEGVSLLSGSFPVK